MTVIMIYGLEYDIYPDSGINNRRIEIIEMVRKILGENKLSKDTLIVAPYSTVNSNGNVVDESNLLYLKVQGQEKERHEIIKRIRKVGLGKNNFLIA